jgi:hypothetical protein
LVEADESATDSVNLWSGPGNGAGPFLWRSTRDETLIMEVLDLRGMTADEEEEDEQEDS